ncbi:MAG: nuclear transport factor 2 family protein [Bryobacterales bacterium]|nr:nuclear transport factor 2 family protein [Bryobacterales bacterium]
MNTTEVADKLVTLCRAGRFVEAVETLYSAGIVSVEAREFGDMPRELRGVEAVKGKNLWWFDNNEVHSSSVTGPFVSPERFAVFFTFDRTFKGTGERSQFSEVAVYTVADGKIVHEEFLYAAED